MSRGPGRIETAILAQLREAGGYLKCHAITDRIHGAADGPVSRALDVSVRRAVKSMAKAGLVECGYLSERPHQVLGCWLPGQGPTFQGKPVWEQDRLSLRSVEDIVLSVLNRITEEECRRYRTGGLREPGQVPYSLLVNKTLHALRALNYHEASARVAIGRAVRRLYRRYLAAQGIERELPTGAKIVFVRAEGEQLLSVAL
jgi:hypothetical protein